MTTRAEISGWFDDGMNGGGLADPCVTHMLVVVDEFDWTDYPVYVTGESELRAREEEIEIADMSHIMEIYNLSMDKEQQLNERRAFNR